MKVRDVLRHFKRTVLGIADRSRILVDPQGGRVALANYKCGFTSLNRCLPDWDKRIDDGQSLWRYYDRQDACVLHMIVRDPVVRFQSFVHGWFVDKGALFLDRRLQREIRNFAYDNLARIAGREAVEKVESLVAEEDMEGLYRYLVFEFPIEAYIELNEHTVPQSRLIAGEKGFVPVDHFYELDSEESMAVFSRNLGVSFPVSNRSSRTRHEVSPEVRRRLEELYADDYRLFAALFGRTEEK